MNKRIAKLNNHYIVAGYGRVGRQVIGEYVKAGVDFMQIASVGDEGLVLEEIVIPAGSLLIGKSVLESELKREYGVTIMGIKHVSEKMILNPEPSIVLQQQDIMILIGQTDKLGQLSTALGL